MPIEPMTPHEEDIDNAKLAGFLDDLVPLAKKYGKSAKEEAYFGTSKASTQDRKFALMDHLLMFAADVEWQASVRYEHDLNKLAHNARKQAYKAAK